MRFSTMKTKPLAETMETKRKVYVAGPLFSSGLPTHNVRSAMAVGSQLIDLGYVPFVPHLNVFWEVAFPRSEAEWLQWDLDWLASCDAMLRLPGHSNGADIEEETAKRLGIPVFFFLHDLHEHFKEVDSE